MVSRAGPVVSGVTGIGHTYSDLTSKLPDTLTPCQAWSQVFNCGRRGDEYRFCGASCPVNNPHGAGRIWGCRELGCQRPGRTSERVAVRRREPESIWEHFSRLF